MLIHETFDQWITNEGNQGIKRAKAIFSWTLNYLLGENPPIDKWIAKSDVIKECPAILETVLPWIIEHPREGLTILRYSDLYAAILDDENCLNALLPITREFEGDPDRPYYGPLEDYSTRFQVPKLIVETGSVPLFTKGPNGISILSVAKDSIALNSQGILPNVQGLGDLIVRVTPDVKISEVIESITDEFRHGKFRDQYKSGRVVFLPEKSGKIRVIAQGDFISQSTLKPIHDTLAGILRSIPEDWTFDQEGGKEWVKHQTATAKWCASFDLSNATDRLPIDLQARIMDRVLPGELGELWSKTLVDREFNYVLPSGKEGNIRYSVGQPMGFFSSFVSFALLHHIVVQYAYEKAHGRPGHKFYAIIGDDMVIFDKAAGDVYLDIIRSIGGVVNLSKSHISTSKGHIVAEFAKAYFINGEEITPFSLRLIKNALENWANVPRMYNESRIKLGRVLHAKKLKHLFQEYWPKEANTLLQLLEVPVELGGIGKPGHTALAKVLRGTSNCFRLYLAYRAFEAYKVIINISDDDLDEATNNITDRSLLRLALQPFLSLLRDRNARIGLSHLVTSRKGFLEWALNEDTPLSALISCVTLMIKELPTSLREKVRRPSIMWVRALADDKRASTPAIDSDDAYHYAFLELVATEKN